MTNSKLFWHKASNFDKQQVILTNSKIPWDLDLGMISWDLERQLGIKKINLINGNGWQLFPKTWCYSPHSIISFWRAFCQNEVKIWSNQLTETLGTPCKFWSDKQAELRKLFKQLLEKCRIVFNLLSLSCLLNSNILMEENLLGRNFATFLVKICENIFPQKKDPHNTYEYLHVLLISLKKIPWQIVLLGIN